MSTDTVSTVETGVKRRSSRLRFLRCFTAVDEESSFPFMEADPAKGTNVGRARRLSDLRRPSTAVAPRQKKCFLIFPGVLKSVFPDSSRAKKHWRRKRHHRHSTESTNKLSIKQDNLDVSNSNKDMETDIVTGSSLSTKTASMSSSSSSSSPSSRSFNSLSSSPCEWKRDSALSLLLITLLAVIVWGKVCAIVCTSTWWCILFGRSNVEEQTQVCLKRPWNQTTTRRRLSRGDLYSGNVKYRIPKF